MIINAEETASQLKIIANPYRLMVLCALVEGAKNVSELMTITGAPQTLMSNHLAVLRNAGIIDYNRDHRTLNYYLKDQRMRTLLETLYHLYCNNQGVLK
ncbi:ArsR/SmtB family transcription factor [Phocoenobacter skyensis]|uniref:DNA-binding transcriptional regulator, ArsR family n=1 Tax=Phocoenobacter skyensis TaxID=97481 RepID=A0A1H7VGQ4_9PAST|nr:metalloregulator ArsR/SmtB family transcription factor [Pasteurella skyensis]MDP8079347.1 metalloregulator ArsR/SmtB family transcription factor [Pasteurella skyensis]MDP8085219.1 metalloregulator ArsR/SmtB family transcription factor [Pasteurella skyensis]MDP8171410.1 metalloregulator ArsR/SmtB family transcription factor [Pasteurella skyensis]MDP8175604.1 metalloregulator ArsR/SmtB family transcription factor [Pasteurella skyensis]MDP8177639.1 metalloregulator ArsR/SmtB family transcripti